MMLQNLRYADERDPSKRVKQTPPTHTHTHTPQRKAGFAGSETAVSPFCLVQVMNLTGSRDGAEQPKLGGPMPVCRGLQLHTRWMIPTAAVS